MKKRMMPFMIAAALLFGSNAVSVLAGNDRSFSNREILKQQDMQRTLLYEQLKEKGGQYSSKSNSLRGALPVDTDDDGIPDSWETANGLNPNDPNDAWLDPDQDEVINLFEYQLGSGLNNPASPPVATVGASGADYADLETAIDRVASGTVIQVAGGTYAVNYITFSSMIVMIQGGWSSDFSRRDLGQYPTTFDGSMQDEILYFSFYSGEGAVILDGIHFVGGNGHSGAVNLHSDGTSFMKTSVVNCSITKSRSDFSSGSVLRLNNWDTSQSDRTIANTVIAGNQGSGIYAQITDDTTVRWRIINTTISQNRNNGSNGYGIDSFTLDNGVLTCHIYNSILWGNEQEDIQIHRNITFNVDHSDIGEVDAGYGGDYSAGPGVMNTNPLFMNPANGDFHLQASSPLTDVGTSSGIPLTDMEGNLRISGTTVDMGPYEYESQIVDPQPDIKANGQNGPITVSPSTSVAITISLRPGEKAGQNADWWVATYTPSGWDSYVYPTGWATGINLCIQTPLFDLSPSFEVLNTTLPIGQHLFYFAVDNNTDGQADATWWDSVEVNVQAANAPPSVPTGLTATTVSSSQINLSWTASTDDVAVTGYKIYRDGTYLKSVTTTSTSDTGLNSSTRYCYTVSAFDGSGNQSAQSEQACATTASAGPVDVVGWWEGSISIPGNSDASIILVFVDDPHLGKMTNVGIVSMDPYIMKQFTGGSFSVSGNTVTFTTEELPSHCDANFNGTGTVSGNYMSGTFGGSDCTLTISNASFFVKRTR